MAEPAFLFSQKADNEVYSMQVKKGRTLSGDPARSQRDNLLTVTFYSSLIRTAGLFHSEAQSGILPTTEALLMSVQCLAHK